MGLLTGLTSDADVKQDEDSLGGVFTFDSGTYDAVIDAAFVEKSKGGAIGLNLHLAMPENKTLRQTLWVSSGDAKGNKNYYVSKGGDKRFLPGYNVASAICKLTVDAELSSFETEERVLSLYDYDAKKELPKKVAMITELLGQEITLGLIKQTVDKNVKDATTGFYVPSGDTKEENEIDRVFRTSDGFTADEVRKDVKTSEFLDKWKVKWTGKSRNKAKGAAKASGVSTGFIATTPKENLFT